MRMYWLDRVFVFRVCDCAFNAAHTLDNLFLPNTFTNILTRDDLDIIGLFL